MPVNESPFSSSSVTTPTKGRSLFSRITTPFAPRTRNCEFEIRLDDPWKSYYPGELVKGKVVVTVTKPLRVTHLTVCLHGFVKVYKHAITPGEPDIGHGYLGPGRGRRGGEYLGNGFASLFEDEATLCGEGRLKEGIYEFEFLLEFPPNLPSSVDFERGTIAYMITATLTRPTTIAPTSSCSHPVQLLESIDIAPLTYPKPRVITLEPISKRSRVKVKVRTTSMDKVPTCVSADQQSFSRSSRTSTITTESLPPLSPAPSEANSVHTSTRSCKAATLPSSNGATTTKGTFSDNRSTSTSLSDKTITATTELLRPGALPGDTIPLKIVINHTKQVQSPHGVIVTLYRQGRVDAHPDIPLGPQGKGKKPQYEDYYPKSKTGLGGLSLSSAGSCNVFRKDLSQSLAPLVVDRRDMTAVIKTSIRIPEDVFPTITRVPGSMITFRYYIEVVIDLRGKLAGQERFLPRLNMTSASYNDGSTNQRHDVRDENGNQITSWNGSILDTDAIRRERSVVSCLFEVIIGSRDSSRGSRRWQQDNHTSENQWYDMGDERSMEEYLAWEHSTYANEYYRYGEYDYNEDQYAQDHDPHTPHLPPTENHFVPPPESEEEVDEKTRLRRAEERLMPSRPPEDESGPSRAGAEPTAPTLDYDRHLDIYHVDENPEAERTPVVASAASVRTIVPSRNDSEQSPSSPVDQEHSTPQDDKRELERIRLMAQASAPDMDGEVDGLGSSSHPAPTAPTLTEDDEYNLGANQHGVGESLPRYQR